MPDNPAEPAQQADGPGQTPAGFQRSSDGGFKWLPPSSEALGKLLPQYEIECLVGRGGMGAVYKGRQKALDRPVAIKILPPEVDDEDATYTERFKNEARIMARLSHPAIVPVYDFGEIADPPMLYFVMEFIGGTDVHQLINSQGRLPPEHALAVAAHVCDALRYAHEQGVVHRDIKPGNVLINMEGQVKVADFGLAKVDEPGATSVTKAGVAMGTPDYVAPEALVMGAQVDARADIYSVGVMLYHMLTGEIPRGAFDLPSKRLGIDPRFDAIIVKAMKMNRDERYASSAAMRKDLDVILTTPRVQAGGQSSAAIPKQTVTVNRTAGSPARSARPGGATAKPPGADKNARTKPVAPPPEKSKVPLFIGIGASAVIAIGGFVLMKGDDDLGKVPAPRTAAPGVAAAQASPPPVQSAPVKVRDDPPKASAGDNRPTVGSPPDQPSPSLPRPPAVSAAKAVPADVAKPQWQKVDWTQDELNQQGGADSVQIEDGWYHVGVSNFRFPSPSRPVSNIAVRYRTRIGQPAFKLKSSLSGGSVQHYLAVDREGLEIVRYDSDKEGPQRAVVLAREKLSASLASGSEAQIGFAAIGNRYAGRLNDTVTEWIHDEEGGNSRSPVFQNIPGAEAWIRDVEFIVLDGLSENEAKALLGWPEKEPLAVAGAAESGSNAVPPATASSTKPSRLPDSNKWMSVFTSADSLAVAADIAEWTDKGIRLHGTLHMPGNARTTDVAIRAKVRLGPSSIGLGARNVGDKVISCSVTAGSNVVAVTRKNAPDDFTALAKFPFTGSNEAGRELLLEIVVVDAAISVSVDGKPVGSVAIGIGPWSGPASAHSTDGMLRDIAWQSLDPANPADEKFAVLEKAYLERLQKEADGPFATAVSALAGKFKSALERSAATVRGSPAEVQIRADIARLEKLEPIPPAEEPKLSATLVSLRKTWHAELEKLRAARVQNASAAKAAHDQALAALQKDLEDKGDMNRAEKIKQARAALQKPDAGSAAVTLAAVKQGPLNARPDKAGKLKMIGCMGGPATPLMVEPFAVHDDYVQVVSSPLAIAALRADGSAVIQRLFNNGQLSTNTHSSPPLTKLFVRQGEVWGLTEDGLVICPGVAGIKAGPWQQLSGVVDFSGGDAAKYAAGLKADGSIVLAVAAGADGSWMPKPTDLPKAREIVCDNQCLMILTEAGGVMAWSDTGMEVKVPLSLRRGIVAWNQAHVYFESGDKEARWDGYYLDKQGNLMNSAGEVTERNVEQIDGSNSGTHWRARRKPWKLNGTSKFGEFEKAQEVLGKGDPLSWTLSSSGLNPKIFPGGATGVFLWIE